MSAPETVQPPPKPEVRQKPRLPSKPSCDASDKDAFSRNPGNVQKIVSKFSQPEVKPPSGTSGTSGGTSGGAADLSAPKKKTKRAPTVKPRSRATPPAQAKNDQAPPQVKNDQVLPLSQVNNDQGLPQSQVNNDQVPPPSQINNDQALPPPQVNNDQAPPLSLVKNDQAPPLPAKRRNTQRMEAAGPAETNSPQADVADGGRSAPDGREVEVQNARLRPEQDPRAPSGPQCEKNCSCICHLQRPGMKLVWVSISETANEGMGEEDQEDRDVGEDRDQECGGRGEEESDGEGPGEAGDEESESCSSDSSEVGDCEDKAPVMNKKRFKATLDLIEGQLRRRSDPGPRVVLTSVNSLPRIPSNLTETPSVSEEESIYEAVIHEILPLKDAGDKALSAPFIQVTKPPRPSKGSECSPPAVPPRVPMEKDRGPRCPRVSPLSQPLGHSMSSKLTPVDQSPPSTPQPVRAPPPLPPAAKPSGRRFSSQSQTLKDEDETSAGGDFEKEEQKPPVGLTRQKSLDMEAHMPEELLYQIYTETYITKEIRRQTVCRNISKTSADFQMDHTHPRTSSGSGGGGPRSSPIPSLKQNTLWQDLPEVRESGILQTLTPEECKYQESMFEVLTSELSYLRSLRVLTEHFQESRELSETLLNLDKKTLFSNILRIREVSEKFLKDLEDRLNESLLIDDICDIISYHAQHNFPAYIDYVRNQIYQEKTYSTLMQTNSQFATVITRLQESPKCQRLPFISFMLLPFQRITRIKMLVENILKRTAEGTEREECTSKALAAVSKIIEECNTEVGKMKQMEELIEINNKLEFDKLKAVAIISQNRFLEKRGELQEVAKGSTLFNLKPRFSPVYLFLFNDLLVIASKKGSERFVVMDHAHRSLVQVQVLSEDPTLTSLENCFCLTLLENHQGRVMERLLKAPSQSDMHRWLAAFPNPEDPNREQEEVIYEDWDCPQVQCVEKYVAIQTDELNLEPPEIINVIRKTNEGWYEGIRLSDGQKGWFPVANVLEITNEHVRRRNLRERYRVMRAASAVTHKIR